MACFEVKFGRGREARVKTLKYAATMAGGSPFVARKILRGNRKANWAKYALVHGKVCCLAVQAKGAG